MKLSQYIYSVVHREGHGHLKPYYHDLRPYLKRRYKRRVKKGLRKSRRIFKPRGPSLENRPIVVGERKRVGDWETNTVESVGHKRGLNTLVDRKSGLVIISRLKDRTSQATTEAIAKRLRN